jgi:hypothetical protein
MDGIIKIQSIVRGFLTRKNLSKIKDELSIEILSEVIDSYNKTVNIYTKINKNLSKKIRMPNLPEVISENVAKYAIYKKYKIMPTWNCIGDLKINDCDIQIKGFTSTGPSSFGPDSCWSILCFVDATKIKIKHFKVYLIFLTNKNSLWKNLRVNKHETFYQQCLQKRRPRIPFKDIKTQLKDEVKLIFDGKISNF